MTRVSRNVFFLLAITVVNVFLYFIMSGSVSVFSKTKYPNKAGGKHLMAVGDDYQDRISQLVKEAVREHGVSGQNLTVMLERAISEHENSRKATDTYIHRGKSNPLEHKVGDTKLANVSSTTKEGSKLLDNGMLVEDKDPAGKSQVGEGAEKPKDADSKSQGVLDRLGGLLSGGNVDGKEVVFPHNYNYVINEPNKCKNADGSDKPVFFLVLILSIHKNFDQRNAIRRTWGSPTEIAGKPIITLFLLAKNSNPAHQRLVEQESRQYQDILMEDFLDTYKNLTMKTIMGMKWASIYCPQASYVMKTDDDMYVSYANIVDYLSKPGAKTSSYVTGFVINGGPIRDPKSKWYMPRETYPGSKYPPFCSGTGYMMSGDMPGRIYQTSLSTPFLYLEDVFVAICLDKLHVVPVNHKSFNNWRTPYSYCKYKRIFTTHMVTATEMNRIWTDQKTVKGYRC
ncbi:beta-1,3-galactosyltransferase 1-like [Diadema antillarum]|uniref:beta-1,3-galactosyltransferase 1-like n=1 Tax=Diadema antillarum TaxID=105358 RepID=UPI003A8AA358